ncbi:MAG: protein translocase subunit SecF [Candidatus Hatepunaea meridiana]|nr:protein translocase subunit SecF [Candidatus Hatepunaea meridiana]
MLKILHNPKLDFQSKRHLAMSISAIVIFIGLLSMVLHGGPNYSIDFSGGLSILLRFDIPEGKPPITEAEVRRSLAKIDLANSEVKLSRSEEAEDILISVKEIGRFKPPESIIRAQLNQKLGKTWHIVSGDQLNKEKLPDLTGFSYVVITTEANEDELRSVINSVDIDNPQVIKHQTIAGKEAFILAGEGKDTVTRIRKVLSEDYPEYTIDLRSIDRVGPRIGAELRLQAIGAILAALSLIVIYLWIRFELLFGVAAVIALFHDVIITLGIFSLLNIEISLTIIGAFLTLVGYSLNDTIVVFDRIRENLKRYKNKSYAEVVNLSINSTLSRTIITSGTTMMVVLVLFFYGGQVLHSFSLALLIGIIVGTYSSIYIASPVLVEWATRTGKAAGRKKKVQ